MIQKVYEVDPMVCPKCGGTMKIIAFITEYAVVDRIIDGGRGERGIFALQAPISGAVDSAARPEVYYQRG